MRCETTKLTGNDEIAMVDGKRDGIEGRILLLGFGCCHPVEFTQGALVMPQVGLVGMHQGGN